jgi:hypothetical protein
LAIPHLLCVWALGIAWFFVTEFAWFAIFLTGRYPEGLRSFAVGVLRWNTRVEAYLLRCTTSIRRSRWSSARGSQRESY